MVLQLLFSGFSNGAIYALIGYSVLCYDGHNVIEYRAKRVEILGNQCPIIESAKRMEMADKVLTTR